MANNELDEAINAAATNNTAPHNSLNVYAKLMRVQQNIKSPKGRRNDFGKYSYRTAEDILQAAKPLLLDVQAVIVIEDKIFNIGTQSKTTTSPDGSVTDAPYNYVEATAKFIDCETGEMVTARGYAQECDHKGMSADQCTGCASSYARKYALNALLCIDSGEDSDGMDNSHSGNKQSSGGWGSKPNNGNGGGWGNNGNNAPQNQNNGGWANNAPQQQSAPQNNGGWGNGAPTSQPQNNAPQNNGGWGNSGNAQQNNAPQNNAPQNNGGWGNSNPAPAPAPQPQNNGGWGNAQPQDNAPQNGGGWGNAQPQDGTGNIGDDGGDTYPF